MIENDVSHTFTDTVRKKFIELGFPKTTSGQLSKIILPFKVDPIEKKVFARCDNFFYLEQIVKPYQEEIHDIVKKCWGENFVFEIDNSVVAQADPETVLSVPQKHVNLKENSIQDACHLEPPVLNLSHSRQSSEQKTSESTPSESDKYKKYCFENFVAIEKNLDALNLCRHIVEKMASQNPKPILFYGDTGTGKTHLLHAIEHAFAIREKKLKVLYVCVYDFVNEIIHRGIRFGHMEEIRKKYNSCDVLLIDDIQSFEKKHACQTEFLHMMSFLLHNNKQLVMTSNKHPKEYKNIDQRLKSRFLQSVIVHLDLPEKRDRFEIIKRKSRELKLSLPDNTVEVLALSLNCNVHEIEGVLNDIAVKTKVLKQNISEIHIASMMRDRLSQSTLERVESVKHVVGIVDLQKMVCGYFNIELDALLGKQRCKKIALARHLAVYFAKMHLNLCSASITQAFKRTQHKIVSYSVKKITTNLAQPEINDALAFLSRHIEVKTNKLRHE